MDTKTAAKKLLTRVAILSSKTDIAKLTLSGFLKLRVPYPIQAKMSQSVEWIFESALSHIRRSDAVEIRVDTLARIRLSTSFESSLVSFNGLRYSISMIIFFDGLCYFANISAEELRKYFFAWPKLNLGQFYLDLYSITSDRKISLRFRFMFFKFDSTLSRKKQYFSTSCFRTLVKNRNSLKISKLFKLFGLGFRFRIK